jgi:hypothetical protein
MDITFGSFHITSGSAAKTSKTRIAARAIASAGCLLLVAACSWVDLEPEAQAVGVRSTEAEVADCTKRGDINAQTTSSVGFISRNDTKVAVELERLARNRAVGLGANTVVPTGPVTAEGTRAYAAYLCPES